MTKAEVEFRQLFTKALKGDLKTGAAYRQHGQHLLRPLRSGPRVSTNSWARARLSNVLDASGTNESRN